MTIDWQKPTPEQIARGIYAVRPIICYCSTDKGIQAVAYFGGYDTEIIVNGKRKKVFAPRSPAVIEYDRDMVIRRWAEGKDLPSWLKITRRELPQSNT